MQNSDGSIGIPPDWVKHDGIVAQSAETWHYPRSTWRSIRGIATGRSIKVAVLDTGCARHKDLPVPVAERSFVPGQDSSDPVSNHGTHCAGTILARDEDIGAAPEAALYVGKVLSNQGSGSSTGIAEGVNWAIDQGVDIISMSLGGGSPHQPTIDAIKRAFKLGIIVCVAAGNSGFSGSSNTIGYPARSGEAVCVGATRIDGSIAGFSSGGQQLIVASPGENILSCRNDGQSYLMMSGTSMATPFTAGCFALIVERMRAEGNPRWTSVQAVNKFIEMNATDRGRPGHDPSFGWGTFDMLGVMDKIASAKKLRFV